jgi:rhodanese-related sulfurtransferase
MDTIVIDVREPYEFSDGHVDGAINIPPDRLMHGAQELEGVDKDTPIIVYCRTGSRSNVAMHILSQLGYSNIKNGINKDQVEARFLNK